MKRVSVCVCVCSRKYGSVSVHVELKGFYVHIYHSIACKCRRRYLIASIELCTKLTMERCGTAIYLYNIWNVLCGRHMQCGAKLFQWRWVCATFIDVSISNDIMSRGYTHVLHRFALLLLYSFNSLSYRLHISCMHQRQNCYIKDALCGRKSLARIQ